MYTIQTHNFPQTVSPTPSWSFPIVSFHTHLNTRKYDSRTGLDISVPKGEGDLTSFEELLFVE